MIEKLSALLFLWAFSSVKFFFAVPAIVFAGYSFIECVLISSLGGLAGFFVFYYIGELKFIRKYFGMFMDWVFRILGIERIQKEKKKFTRMNRLIVKIRGKYGLIGLAILTPSIFSIPLGSLLAARYYDKNRSTIPYMVTSIILWSLVLTFFYQFLYDLMP